MRAGIRANNGAIGKYEKRQGETGSQVPGPNRKRTSGYPVPKRPERTQQAPAPQELPKNKSSEQFVNDQIDKLVRRVAKHSRARKTPLESQNGASSGAQTAVGASSVTNNVPLPEPVQLSANGLPLPKPTKPATQAPPQPKPSVLSQAGGFGVGPESSTARGFGAVSTSEAQQTFGQASGTFKVFLYAADQKDTESAIKACGWRDKVQVTRELASANAVLAIKLGNFEQGERMARNADIPFVVVGRDMTAKNFKETVGPLLASRPTLRKAPAVVSRPSLRVGQGALKPGIRVAKVTPQAKEKKVTSASGAEVIELATHADDDDLLDSLEDSLGMD